MSQSTQFPPDVLAPIEWVHEIAGTGVAAAIWMDGSYGNDAAPSWILVDPSDAVCAQAFYYTTENAERFAAEFRGKPYVAVSLIQDDQVMEYCVVDPLDFLQATRSAVTRESLSPRDALRTALEAVGVSWSRTAT
jgi:hypothetical protein